MLNRECILEARCTDAYGNLFVSIAPGQAPDRDICYYLLQQGFGWTVTWNLRTLPAAVQQKYVQAERAAQQQKIAIWTKKQITAQKNQNEARVIQVLSGDSIVLDTGSGKELRCQLASIRAPRMGNRRGGFEEDPEPF